MLFLNIALMYTTSSLNIVNNYPPMTTQVSFVTDSELKNKALQRAKSEGITLKALLTYAMKSFVEGKISLNLAFVGSEPNLFELKPNEINASLLKKADVARKSKKSDLMNL
jgi:hypothetical protein